MVISAAFFGGGAVFPCGTTKTLAHYFIAMGNRQMCADCGYMT